MEVCSTKKLTSVYSVTGPGSQSVSPQSPQVVSGAPSYEIPTTREIFQDSELIKQVSRLAHLIESKREQMRSLAERIELPEGWTLELERRGAGATYYAIDENGVKQWVIKPNDEDVFLINNPKGYDSLDTGWFGVFPYYENVQTAVAAYQIAALVGIEWITPKTKLGIMENGQFHLFGDHLPLSQREGFKEATGMVSREKLVSVQEFCHGSLPFDEVYYDYIAEGKPFILDQRDYEAVMLLEWLTGEGDGHFGNLLVMPNEDNTFGVRKVDNNLCLFESNTFYNNYLAYFEPNNGELLSEEIREKIAVLPLNEIADTLRALGKSEGSISALLERAEAVQYGARENMTIKDIEQIVRRSFDENA